ncbi:MAG: hypothetical protein KI790_20290 [Cyclobacteriaceae bacterium]|nr:hypothetical protein [Cyclobacteriaceae bacterium HetDA_MAG_MS6]
MEPAVSKILKSFFSSLDDGLVYCIDSKTKEILFEKNKSIDSVQRVESLMDLNVFNQAAAKLGDGVSYQTMIKSGSYIHFLNTIDDKYHLIAVVPSAGANQGKIKVLLSSTSRQIRES